MVTTGQGRVERRLVAILAADVAGYSRLTGLDEEGTHAQLQDHLHSLVDPKITQHRGRIVKNAGDGLLAEFSSVVDAVRCAVEVQRGMAERNAAIPKDKRIEFRMGINVGDIIIDHGDIFGDGVNVAAKIRKHCGGWRHLRLGRGLRTGARQGAIRLYGQRRAAREEHHAPGACLLARGCR